MSDVFVMLFLLVFLFFFFKKKTAYVMRISDWSSDVCSSDLRQLADSVLGRLEAFAPGLRSLILAQDVLTPADIERETGAAGGHWHHCELAVDQMLSLRPVNGLARYRLPVGGL